MARNLGDPYTASFCRLTRLVDADNTKMLILSLLYIFRTGIDAGERSEILVLPRTDGKGGNIIFVGAQFEFGDFGKLNLIGGVEESLWIAGVIISSSSDTGSWHQRTRTRTLCVV